MNEKGNTSAHSGVQPREPATITLCHEGFGLADYDGSPTATYSKESSQGDGAGNDTVRAVGLPALSNQVAVEGFMDYTDDGCMARRY